MNPKDFATKFGDVLDNDPLGHNMGTFGRKRVEQALSWDHSKEQLLRAHGKLFHRGQRQ